MVPDEVFKQGGLETTRVTRGHTTLRGFSEGSDSRVLDKMVSYGSVNTLPRLYWGEY